MAVAWVFPGQGSHHVGMAQAWLEVSSDAREALREAELTLGWDLGRLVAEGPFEALSETQVQQPAVLAVSVAIARAVAGRIPAPDYVAGHSLGEYSALVVADALDYADALRLVQERGRLMAKAGQMQAGAMAAVLGLDEGPIEELCRELGTIQVANYNCPGQTVISGRRETIDEAVPRLLELGAKRVVPLAITIAAHSRLMATIADEFAAHVVAAPMRDPQVPVIGNVTALPLRDRQAVKEELTLQMTAPVRWTETIRWLASAGVDAYYEVGPKNVLSDLIRRTLRTDGRSAAVFSLAEPAALDG